MSLNNLILVKIPFCQFLENGRRYRVETFSINLIFNGLSNDISNLVLAKNFIISTLSRYVDNTDFVSSLEEYNRHQVEFSA